MYKYNRIFVAFFLGVFLLSSQLMAQTTTYIVDKDGNKIEGDIKNINKKSRFKYIIFKRTGDRKYKKYTPEDLKLFGVGGSKYISTIVTVNTRKTVSIIGERGLPEETQNVSVFLQKLYDINNKALYHTRAFGVAYYFIQRGDSLDVLYYKKYTVNNENGNYSGELKKYIGQLKLYLNDCSSIQKDMDKVLYTQSSLSRVFRSYAKCVGVVLPPKEKKYYKRKFGLLLGVAFSKLNFHGGSSNFSFLTDTDFSGAFTVNAGFTFQHGSKKNYTFLHELAYLRYKARGGYTDIISLTEIENSYLKLNNLVKRRIQNSDTYAIMGLSTGLRLSSTTTNTSLESPPKGGLIGVFKRSRLFEVGPMFGLGIDSRFGSLDFRIEFSNGPSDSPKSSLFRHYFNYSIYF